MSDPKLEREFTAQEKEYMHSLSGCIWTFVAIIVGLIIGAVLSIVL
ncbi:MAG: hypothetical protein IJP44_10290 [Bacteroidales bacterium]|nr:hypothetical protein [Bacteroidales bacterium]